MAYNFNALQHAWRPASSLLSTRVLSFSSVMAARTLNNNSNRYVAPAAQFQWSGVRSLSGHVRPISPHVTIYKQPIPAISSITHRITGTVLSGTQLLHSRMQPSR